MDQLDPMVQQALELGERNAETIELVRNHCSHAQVEHHPAMGYSMLEGMTGLPISGRTVKCQYAAKPPNFGAADLMSVALSFYENNCVDCPHRNPRGIPNLGTVAVEIEKEEQATVERLASEHQQEAEERERRHRAREERVMNEPQTSRDLIRLVNELDAEPRSSTAGEDLVAAVRAKPNLLTRPSAGVLLDAAATALDEHVLEAVRIAAEAGVISPEEALEAAADALAVRPMIEPARILLRFRAGASRELLERARGSLISRVGRGFGPSFEFTPPTVAWHQEQTDWRSAFEVLIEFDLAGVLAEIEEMLQDEQEYRRERAAAAVEVLVDLHPEIAPVVSSQLVAALKLSTGFDRYGVERRAEDAISAALTRCLWQRPEEVAAVIEAVALELNEQQRHSLFDAYDSVIRHYGGRGEVVPSGVGGVVVEAALRHAKGDWGQETRRAAHDLLELISKWQGHLLDDRPQALFALLIEEIANRPGQPTALESADNVLAALENMSKTQMQHARIRDIRETIGGVAVRKPREVLELILAFLSAAEPETEEMLAMRAECVWLLGFVGKRSEFLPEVLPPLYGGLVHNDQVVRAYAIRGLIEITQAHPSEVIPPQFSATLPALLTDPFMIVHRGAASALTRGVPVRDEHRPQVVSILLYLADYYAKNDADSDTLDDVLRSLQLLSARDPDPANALAVKHIVSKLAVKLDDYDLQHFLERNSRTMLEIPSYVDALLNALQRPNIIHEPNSSDSRLRAILYSVPPSLLLPRAAELAACARANLPRKPRRALEYVGVFQRLGLWDDAVALADEVVATVPTTIDEAVARTYAEMIAAAARVEAAIAVGTPDIVNLVQAAVDAAGEHDQAAENAEARLPWLV